MFCESEYNKFQRGISCRAEKPVPVVLGPPLARCRFQLLQDGDALPVDFEMADVPFEEMGDWGPAADEAGACVTGPR